ncbi:MAG: L,D-transpeptidase family protein [Firmicutes bacterium]|nr:L,D-transpeptidase family protein [Bacillota bacterium]
MNKSQKCISSAITFIIASAFVACAAIFALNYNTWFAADNSEQAASNSDIINGKITINMDMTDINNDLSDDELAQANQYGFPTGDTPYFIYVEKGAHTLSVFLKDDYGLYNVRVATWSTATGKSASMTPTGIFTIGKKEEWHRWPANTYSPYTSTYYETNNHYGGLFIHGPIYQRTEFSSVFSTSVQRIGTSCSSGCLRTEVEAAYFVYKMCDEGTQVKIVEGSPLGFTPDRKVYVANQKSMPDLDNFSMSSIPPRKIEFAKKSHTMTLGEEYKPEVVTTPSYAKNINGTWTTNNPSIVKVSGGTIWAVGTGTAIVTLTTAEGGLTASMVINVKVGNVDTSAEPPDVGGKVTQKNDNITEDYRPISESIISLTIDGKVYAINQKAAPLIRSLGRNYHVSKAQSCAYEGYDKVYTYTYRSNGSCEISTVPLLAGEDTICEIAVKNYINKDIESSKGIKLGDRRGDIEKAYGKFYTEEVVDATDSNEAYTRMIYWAGEPNKPGVAYLYFILNPESDEVTGMGIFSARNIG